MSTSQQMWKKHESDKDGEFTRLSPLEQLIGYFVLLAVILSAILLRSLSL